MSNITNSQYWIEVEAVANAIAEEAMIDNDFNRDAAGDEINDFRLHEAIDGHQWIIYNAYNLDVYQYSGNSDYLIDNFGTDEAGEILKKSGLGGLHQALAYWAFYADVQDKINDCLDEVEEEHEKDQDQDDQE